MTEDTAPGGDWDINETGWEPIGLYDDDYYHCSPFKGVFDGNGHKVIGMNIHGNVQYSSVGLFGCIRGAVIKNLSITNCNINISNNNFKEYVGAIAGLSSVKYTYDISEICNSFVNGTINVVNNPDTYYYDFYIGGIVGYDTKVYDAYSSLDISVTNYDSRIYIAGIVGYAEESYSCYNCYNTGNISVITGTKAEVLNGAICGYEYYLSNCYYLTGTCEGQESVSGKCQAMSIAQMKSQAAFKGWDFENTWVIDSTSSYKYPQLRSCMQVPVTEVALVSAPEKTVYNSGDSIDLTDGKISVMHDDDSSGELDIKEDMLGKYDIEQVGKQSISVNYIGKSAVFDITVNPKAVSNLKISSVTDDSASLSWNRTSTVTGYIIYKYDFEKETWNECNRLKRNHPIQ